MTLFLCSKIISSLFYNKQVIFLKVASFTIWYIVIESISKKKDRSDEMSLNPILKELGFSKNDKTVIIHADDVGLNHSAIEAYAELMDLGTISSGSVMAHTSWLPEVVKQAKENKHWDLGVHAAFNGEYKTYKWRPLSTTDKESGFIDAHGFFVEDKAQVQETADPAYLERELDAQIQLALDLGLDVSHVDTHTGTLWNKKFMESYVSVYNKFNIMPVLFNPKEDAELIRSMVPELNIERLAELGEMNFPLVDGISGLPVEHTYDIDERFELAKQMLKAVQPGKLIHFAFHPIKDSPETQALDRYTGGRTGDFEVFRKKEMKAFLENEGIQLVNYTQIRDVLNQ